MSSVDSSSWDGNTHKIALLVYSNSMLIFDQFFCRISFIYSDFFLCFIIITNITVEFSRRDLLYSYSFWNSHLNVTFLKSSVSPPSVKLFGYPILMDPAFRMTVRQETSLLPSVVCLKGKVKVSQLCPALCNPMD